MIRYWGIHNAVRSDEEQQIYQGKFFIYESIPFNELLNAGDYVYFFRDNAYLYGWGHVHEVLPIESPQGRRRMRVTVFRSLLQPQLATVETDIRRDPVFNNYLRLQDEGLSNFSVDQAKRLNQLCKKGGTHPPNPDDTSLDLVQQRPPRPEITKFTHNEKLPIEETRFDEFKEITTSHPGK